MGRSGLLGVIWWLGGRGGDVYLPRYLYMGGDGGVSLFCISLSFLKFLSLYASTQEINIYPKLWHKSGNLMTMFSTRIIALDGGFSLLYSTPLYSLLRI